MLGSYPSLWWRICWRVFTPLVLMVNVFIIVHFSCHSSNTSRMKCYFENNLYKIIQLLLSNKTLKYIIRKCNSICFQFILVFSFIDYGQPQYGNYIYPGWAQLIGWLICVCVMIWIPVVAIFQTCKQKGSIKRVDCFIQPTVKTILLNCY